MTMLKKRLQRALLLVCAATCAFAADSDIRLNSVGFLPNFPKTATIAAKPSAVVIRRAGTATNLYRVLKLDSTANSDTKETALYIADFSDFDTPGQYYLYAQGVGNSPTFTIGDNAFVEPYRAVMLGFYLWRCGAAVSASYGNKSYSHGACHINDGNRQYYDDVNARKDGTGGWHDAGDYNKYTVNSGAAVAFTLKTWEHFHHILKDTPLISVSNAGALPAYLAEVKWNLDWVAKMQFDDGRVSHKLSTLDFGGEIMPETENTTRYFAPWSTAATGSFVGQMAMAARLYAPYNKVFADSCLAKAERSYDLLMASPLVRETQPPFKTGEYGTPSSGDEDKRLFAAVEMWETTGDAKYLEYVETNLPTSVDAQISWQNVRAIAVITYLNSRREGRDIEKTEALWARLIASADALVAFSEKHGYGRNISLYNWGANGTVAGTAYLLHSAYLRTGDIKYRHAIQDVVSHLFGRNYYGRSFVTGVGHNPPQSPHDRTSSAQKTPWPGRLIGGPHNSKNGAPSSLTNCESAATCWFDVSGDYWTNEVAINWNAPLVYALAAIMPGAEARPYPSYPGQPVEIEVSVRHSSATPKSYTGGVKSMRVTGMRNETFNLPAGAKVYGLNGKLIARNENHTESIKLRLRKNGVYIIKFDL